MKSLKIIRVSAYVVDDQKNSQDSYHWIVGQISSPMSRYPEYRKSRQSWHKNVLGKIIVEAESEDGTLGFSVGVGGYPAAWIIEQHLANFAVGKTVDQIGTIWDQMYLSTIHYGRKGLVLHAISAVDLALWDLLGKIENKPVYDLIGGKVRDEIDMYATGPNPVIAQKIGFLGGKLPLIHHPSEGESGFYENVSAFKEAREVVGDDFYLMYDCWMSLDLLYASRLAKALQPYSPKWLEECFIPDDYWSYDSFKRSIPKDILIATGEHEYTFYGFRLLLERKAVDIIQPDITWCGGLTELLKISKLADSNKTITIPHCSGVYSYHFVFANSSTPFAEFVVQSPDGSSMIPFYHPILKNEPVPHNGKLSLSDEPGFGVQINKSLKLTSPSLGGQEKV